MKKYQYSYFKLDGTYTHCAFFNEPFYWSENKQPGARQDFQDFYMVYKGHVNFVEAKLWAEYNKNKNLMLTDVKNCFKYYAIAKELLILLHTFEFINKYTCLEYFEYLENTYSEAKALQYGQ